jgi:ABC-type phosphate transport system permease subunit
MRREAAPDMSGMGAGLTIVGSILLCALVAALIGWPLGVPLPLGLAGAAVGLVLGFYAVWLRYFRRP